MNLKELAQQNLEALRINPYPGRAVIAGLCPNGNPAMITWTQSRSVKNRNRVYREENGRVFTDIADRSKLEPDDDTSLILYDAMDHRHNLFVASNGKQTEDILSVFGESDDMACATQNWSYEPDPPNCTSRISVVCSLYESDPLLSFALLRKSPWDDTCERLFFRYENVPDGYGLLLTTYTGDGKPLPPWRGEPVLVEFPYSGPRNLRDHFWDVLNVDNRISIAVKVVNRQSLAYDVVLKNKYDFIPPV